jgi:hypothetical protein
MFSMCTLIFAHMALQVTNGVGKDSVINNGACSCSTDLEFYSLLAFLLIDLVVLKWFHLIRFLSDQIFARVVLEDGISLTEVGGLLQEWDGRNIHWRTASHPRVWGACWSPSEWRGPNIH